MTSYVYRHHDPESLRIRAMRSPVERHNYFAHSDGSECESGCDRVATPQSSAAYVRAYERELEDQELDDDEFEARHGRARGEPATSKRKDPFFDIHSQSCTPESCSFYPEHETARKKDLARARLDTEGTARPLTELIGHLSEEQSQQCIGPETVPEHGYEIRDVLTKK